MIASNVKIHANLFIEVRDAATAELIETRSIKNLVVTAGRNLIRDLLFGNYAGTPAYLRYLAVGTGTTAPTPGDTALGAEVYRDPAGFTSTSFADGQCTVQYYLSSTAANGNILGEAGCFTASSGGTMGARALITPTINKTASVTVTFSWVFSIAAS